MPLGNIHQQDTRRGKMPESGRKIRRGIRQGQWNQRGSSHLGEGGGSENKLCERCELIKYKPYYGQVDYSPFVAEHCTGAEAPAPQTKPAGQRSDESDDEIELPEQNRPAGHDTQAPETTKNPGAHVQAEAPVEAIGDTAPTGHEKSAPLVQYVLAAHGLHRLLLE